MEIKNIINYIIISSKITVGTAKSTYLFKKKLALALPKISVRLIDSTALLQMFIWHRFSVSFFSGLG